MLNIGLGMYSENKPWGSYHVLEERVGYKVKRIAVLNQGRLSLQSHKHRSEHWTVVNGTATVTVDDSVFTLTRGQSIDIPLGAKHRLENFGEGVVEVIEVQFGGYLGEDDIVRYDDIYNRT
jgi:mannose-6-phosphate isomerase-like protein (cupin superfamily)